MGKTKINIQNDLYQKVMTVLNSYSYDDIYSIIFFVYANECYEYKEYQNLTEFTISYNSESYFKKEYEDYMKRYKKEASYMDTIENGRFSEIRWNYAYMQQDETPIINEDNYEFLIQWYKQEGIENIGYEDSNCYDENMMYIGKGPIGYMELLQEITQVAKRIQSEDYFFKKTGKRLPIIILDYENTWYTVDATKEANIHNEANDYLVFINTDVTTGNAAV